MITFEEVLSRSGRKLDEDQLAAVMTDTNCVVSAGAGSGKTTVLSYRFLRLVLEQKADCDQILTLTFTRKAAREMYDRIHKHLLSCSGDDYVDEQLKKFPKASIATLDSFCSTIVRSDCIRYGLSADFTVDDEQTRRIIQRCARAHLDTHPQSPGARYISELYNPQTLVDDVLVKLMTQEYYLPKQVPSYAQDTVFKEILREYDILMQQFQYILHRWAAFTEISKSVEIAREVGRTLLGKLSSAASHAERFALLGGPDYYFRKPGKGSGDDFLFLKETVDEFRSLRKSLSIALGLLAEPERLASVAAFVQDFVADCHTEKRRTGVLTFSDISSLAIDILKNNKELRSYYKKKFHYVMIDEFQDNNEQQKQLLYLLGEQQDRASEGIPEPGDLETSKLFFVGDEKQSIYRFRGADVSVFKQLSKELEALGGVSLELATNYRSEPALIELFNQMFPKIMQNDGESYEADFKSLKTRSAKEGISASCTILVKPYGTELDEEDAKNVESEAYALAQLVRRMLEGDDFLIPSKQGPRRPLPSDIALLMRSTSNQLSFEKAFRLFSIPYSVQAARALMLEAPANDLYAMLQITLYPSDKQAYATVLRSPFCNLSDFALFSAMEAGFFVVPEEMEESDRVKLADCKRFYDQLCQAVGHKSLSEVVLFLWYASSYYFSLITKPSTQMYAEHFDFLYRLAQMQEQQGKSMSQFLDFLRENLGQNEKIDDLEVIKEQNEGVQIMTVHKSKGLEFPIVLLASAGSTTRSRGKEYSTFADIALPKHLHTPFYVSETKTGVIESPSDLLDAEDERARELAELKRLFYVAVTRAETHLVVSGCFTRNNRSTPNNHLLMACESLEINIEEPGMQAGIASAQEIPTIVESLLFLHDEESSEAFKQRIADASAWYKQTQPSYDLSPLRYAVTALHTLPESGETDGRSLPLYESDAILSNLGTQAVADFGTFVHRLCEEGVLKHEVRDLLSLMPPELVKLLTKAQQEIFVADAQMLCQNFVESLLYKDLVEPNAIQCEVPFFCRVEHEGRTVVAEGSVDLLVDTPEGLVVIDFKTDRRENVEVHHHQVHTYMVAMQRLYKKPVKGCIVYLRAPEAISWWKLEDGGLLC